MTLWALRGTTNFYIKYRAKQQGLVAPSQSVSVTQTTEDTFVVLEVVPLD
jgi:hypothetical protein